jgi:hypothetical protein
VFLLANTTNIAVVFREKLPLVFGCDQFVAKTASCQHDSFLLIYISLLKSRSVLNESTPTFTLGKSHSTNLKRKFLAAASGNGGSKDPIFQGKSKEMPQNMILKLASSRKWVVKISSTAGEI